MKNLLTPNIFCQFFAYVPSKTLITRHIIFLSITYIISTLVTTSYRQNIRLIIMFLFFSFLLEIGCYISYLSKG